MDHLATTTASVLNIEGGMNNPATATTSDAAVIPLATTPISDETAGVPATTNPASEIDLDTPMDNSITTTATHAMITLPTTASASDLNLDVVIDHIATFNTSGATTSHHATVTASDPQPGAGTALPTATSAPDLKPEVSLNNPATISASVHNLDPAMTPSAITPAPNSNPDATTNNPAAASTSMTPHTKTAWVAITSADISVSLPQPGELIRLPYEMANLNFPYGPRSVIASSFGSQASYPGGPKPRHALVSTAVRSPNGSVRIKFYPIVSYWSPSKGWQGPWKAREWMETASEVSQLHHIPIPATDWDPEPHPALGFRLAFKAGDKDWKNSRPAWIAACQHTLSINKDGIWYRCAPAPVTLLNAEMLGHLSFYLQDLKEIVNATATRVNYAALPSYDNIWKTIFTKPTGGFYPENPRYVDMDEDEIWDSEDGDFFSVWRHADAPAAMQEEVKRFDDDCLVSKIMEWDNCGEEYEPLEENEIISDGCDSNIDGTDYVFKVERIDIGSSASDDGGELCQELED